MPQAASFVISLRAPHYSFLYDFEPQETPPRISTTLGRNGTNFNTGTPASRAHFLLPYPHQQNIPRTFALPWCKPLIHYSTAPEHPLRRPDRITRETTFVFEKGGSLEYSECGFFRIREKMFM
ncbi:hypothetical protein CEXT_294641 [Caerostris extrusa]|uniref:Uncharacterized protein n=1 Tax=Caerostris extrusa TaxID=172846 RepID=A0AAV4RRV5_CAEEX|nr:hypothetical protein CEXT_294641 [Caerostris extrusa]